MHNRLSNFEMPNDEEARLPAEALFHADHADRDLPDDRPSHSHAIPANNAR
jgi:hypothetical protein